MNAHPGLKTTLLLAALLAFMALALGSCFTADEFLFLVQLHEDGSATVSILATNLSGKVNVNPLSGPDTKKEERPMTRDELLEEVADHCANEIKENDDAKKVTRCGTDVPAELFGSFIMTPQVSKDRVDAFETIEYADALTYFTQIAKTHNDDQKTVIYNHTPDSYVVGGLLEAVPGAKAGSFMIQSPWPIAKTNADVVFHRYNIAVWNTRQSPESIWIELQSAKP